MPVLTVKEGAQLVKLARAAVKKYFQEGKLKLQKIDSKISKEKMGIFVTINSYPSKDLRGCIGFIKPMPVVDCVQKAAVAAAFEDPRFPALNPEELESVVFEVSLLSSAVQIKSAPEKFADNIEAGKDGLILICGDKSGLFLPQVWEQIPEKDIFLRMLCMKADLTPDYLQHKDTKLYKFTVQAFEEHEPNGKVVKVD